MSSTTKKPTKPIRRNSSWVRTYGAKLQDIADRYHVSIGTIFNWVAAGWHPGDPAPVPKPTRLARLRANPA